MEKKFLLNYGSDLDYLKIDSLIEKYLIGKNKLSNDSEIKDQIELVFDTFDFNKSKHRDNDYIFGTYYLSRDQFLIFEEKFKSLKGNYAQLKPNIRGHHYVTINEKEYTARVFETLENIALIFIDDDSHYNEELREKIYQFPEDLQLLRISKDEEGDYDKREKLVEEWIRKMLSFNTSKLT